MLKDDVEIILSKLIVSELVNDIDDINVFVNHFVNKPPKPLGDEIVKITKLSIKTLLRWSIDDLICDRIEILNRRTELILLKLIVSKRVKRPLGLTLNL